MLMLQGCNPNWSFGKRPNRSEATTSCPSLSYYPLLLFPPCLVLFVFRGFLSDQSALASLSYTFHWRSISVSSPCHMLVSKTNEHVYPNVVETFFSFNSLAAARCSLSAVCFPSISHKSDLSKTLNTELPMFHPE